MKVGMHQGCVMSLGLFKLFMEGSKEGKFRVHGSGDRTERNSRIW